MIYTIQKGDTLYTLAQRYNTTINDLVSANGLTRPNDLAVGQNIFIPDNTQPTSTYTVMAGDTMYLISRRLGVSLDSLITANPQISNPNYITIGQVINIPSAKRPIEVNGYAIANISENTLNRTLPYLTWLSIFSYQANSDGSLSNLYEENIINTTRNASVAPLMVVTNLSNDGFDSNLARAILSNPQTAETLINNIINIATAKNYYGVNVDFEYIYPEDRELYNNFLRNLKSRLSSINKVLTVAVAPKYRDNQEGILYEAHDYRTIGEIADRVIIMTYEWGYLYGEPMAIAPYSEVEAVISYAVTRIPPEKILMGMPNYAYDWALPFNSGDSATAITNTRALEIALENNSNIMFDEKAQAPYFNYVDSNGRNHVVWFEDARSIDARLNIVDRYNLAGVSYWTINNFFAPNWSVIDSKYEIVKVL